MMDLGRLKLCYCDAEGGNVPEEDCRECVLLHRQGLKPDEYMKCQFHGVLKECGCEDILEEKIEGEVI